MDEKRIVFPIFRLSHYHFIELLEQIKMAIAKEVKGVKEASARKEELALCLK
jgi:hypothetical protein